MKALKQKISRYFFKRKMREIEQGEAMYEMLENVLG